MGVLEKEIAAYEKMRDFLEREHLHEWVVIHGEELSGAYCDFQVAAAEATRRFGRGPYLIRQVGAPPVTLPASVLFRPVAHADN
jgi:hypothetical protein